MSKNQQNYQMLYFTTPFCGVCKSAKPLIEMLAMSLEVPLREENMHHFTNTYDALSISKTPAVALVYEQSIVCYSEDINNLSDLFQRFDEARSSFDLQIQNND